MDDLSGSTPIRLTTAELLAVAREHEPAVTERTLELWRHQDLLPHAERTGQDGVRPLWTYPAEATQQLRALLRLRTATKDPNILRAALWFEGHPVPIARAQSSMVTALRKLRTDVEKEVAKRSASASAADSRTAAIADIALELAGQRKTPIPRLARQSRTERAQAFETILRLGFGDDVPPDELGANADGVERLMGLHRTRRYRSNGIEPWLTGPADGSFPVFQQVGSLPNMITTLESARADELEQARSTARNLLVGLVAFSQLADAFAGYHNASGLAMAVALKEQPLIPLMLLAWMLVAQRSESLSENLITVSNALTGVQSVHAQARALAALPAQEREARLASLPWPEQRRLSRMIEAVIGAGETSDATDRAEGITSDVPGGIDD